MSAAADGRTRRRVPALARAVRVLEQVSLRGPLSLSELARALSLPKSSLLRDCADLVAEQLLIRRPDGSYELGMRVAELASARLSRGAHIETIGFSIQSLANPFFVCEVEAVEHAAAEHGCRAIVRDADGSVERQLHDIRSLLDDGIDALIVDAVDSLAIEPAVRSAQDAGVPVVAVNVGAAGADATVTTDNTQAGELVGRFLGELLGGAGEVAIIDGTPVTAVADRINGLLNALKDYPGVRLVAREPGNNTREQGYESAMRVFEHHRDVDAFFGINDPTSLGIAEAAERAGREDVRIASVDGSQAAASIVRAAGPIVTTAAQDPRRLARGATQLAIRMHGGYRPAPRTRLVPTTLVTVDNADEYVPWG
jgi:ribose transport system substrate-binding protein